MSGSGKSYWAKQLESKGFRRFSIDEILEEKLSDGLKHLGYSGINDLAKWMRQPYEDRYAATSRTYLDYEKKAMLETLHFIEMQNNEHENIVIDTTGSVIYLDEEILEKLSNLTKVVYLDTPASVKQEMYELYKKEPKPVIWGESFYQKNGESPVTALARCYPELLAFRTKQYEKLADITMDYHTLHDTGYSFDKFIEKIKNDSL